METTPAPAAPLSVLVVDDDEDTTDSMVTLLALYGYAARSARSGEDALREAAADPPDVVFLDIRMPGMDGWELSRRLRQQTAGKRLLVVAVSGCGLEHDRRRSLDAGADLHLTKPVEPAALAAVLERFRNNGHRTNPAG